MTDVILNYRLELVNEFVSAVNIFLLDSIAARLLIKLLSTKRPSKNFGNYANKTF